MSGRDEPLNEAETVVFARHDSLGAAVKANDLEWCRVFAEHTRPGEISLKQWNYLFLRSAETADAPMLNFLVQQGADWTVCQEVMLGDHSELVDLPRMLIEHGRGSVLTELIDQGAIPIHHRSGAGGDTLLMFALAKENTELAEALLRRGGDLEAANLSGFTALHQSALQGRLASAVWLMEQRANPEAATVAGTTPAELIPEIEGDPDADLMFSVFEEYSACYAQDQPYVPERLKERLEEVKKEAEAAKAKSKSGATASRGKGLSI